MKVNVAAPVTRSMVRAFWRFKSRNNLLYWLTCPVWLPALVIAGYVALGLTRLGYQAERFLGAMGVDAWK
jgi:hypothetical protein